MVNQQFAFAVHALAALAVSPDQTMTSELIASSVNTNPVVIRRLLSKLSKSSLIETHLGKKGGAKLIRKPEQITLKDIYEAIQERTLISQNTKETNRKCPISCKMKDIMKKIVLQAEKATLDHLASIRLSDLTKEM